MIVKDKLHSIRPGSLRSLLSWVLYDWANSAHAAIIQTFVYAAYFVGKVAPDKTEGVYLWGWATGFAGLLVAIGGPFLGALADRGGHRKGWLAVLSILCISSIALMWFVRPDPAYMHLGLILIVITIASSEFAYMFYNAMLPELSGPEEVGKWSGWGWASGYAGGMLSLIICLIFFINDGAFSLNLDRGESQEIRATFLFSAAWFAVFALPIFLYTPSVSKNLRYNLKGLVRDAFKQLRGTILQVQTYGDIYRFLIARMLYMDGLVTLFAFGGVYAAATFNMDTREVLLFGIALNITAGIGATIFAFFDDLYGGKSMIIISLSGLIIAGMMALAAQSAIQFWAWGMLVGVFVGPVQASSRSYLARVTPVSLRCQMFGFFALSAKVTAFLGPLLVSWITYATGSLRLGMISIIVLLIFGFLLMLTVKKDLYC